MPSPRDIFLTVRPKLTNFRNDGEFALGDLYVDPSDETLQRQIRELNNDGVIEEIRSEGKLLGHNAPISGAVSLSIITANIPGYFETWSELIRCHPYAPPPDYLVYDKAGIDDNSYLSACALLALLKQRAEVWDETQLRFFLVDSQAVEIPIIYTAERTVNIAGHLDMIMMFLDPKHLEADSRWNFFRKAAIRAVCDTTRDARLDVFFAQIGNIIERATQDFSLYLERYSFEDALKGFDEKRLKFIADLNQVLASVQAALLAVPVGYFLIAEKIKQASCWIGQNIIIGSGGVIFCAILLVLLRNQGRTLKEVRKAIDDFGKDQAAKNTPKAALIDAMVKNAVNHSGRILFFLKVVTVLVILFAVVIVAAVVWASNPEIQKLVPYSLEVKGAPGP